MKTAKEVVKNIIKSDKIEIELSGNGKLISTLSNELGDKFKDTNDLYFKENLGEIVEINNKEFSILKPNRFITLVEKYFNPCRITFNKKSEVKTYCSMNSQTSNVVLASSNFQNKMKKINRIFSIPIPIIYKNELTFAKEGYDERFKSWLPFDSPKINETLTLKEAIKNLKYIYSEFCFQDKQDFINAIAGLITPALRGLFSDFNVRVPLFVYLANRERAGKDYCAGINGIVYEGFDCRESAISTGEKYSSNSTSELRKKLTSSLIAGKKRLHFENNKGLLNNAILEGFITQRFYSDRLLGLNKNVNFSKSALALLSVSAPFIRFLFPCSL